MGLLVAAAAGVPTVAAAQGQKEKDKEPPSAPPTIEVLDLTITGTKGVSNSDLHNIIVTRANGFFPWSAHHEFDRAEFEADLRRIQAYYEDRGFPDARVSNVGVTFNAAHTGVRLRIDVDEGQPIVVADVRFEGFDVVPAAQRTRLETAPIHAGDRRDRAQVKAAQDLASRLLHDNGYPLGYVDAGERPADAADPRRVILTFRAIPGDAMVFGDVTIDGLKGVGEDVVRRELAFTPGAVYRQQLLVRSQHRLSALQLFSVASVMARLDRPDGNRVPVHITLGEAPMHQLEFGVGYGTEEKARGTIDWRHVNLFGGARQGELQAKGSFLDSGVKLSLVQPYLFHPGLSLTVTGTAWRTNQLTYDSETYGGRVTLGYQTEAGVNQLRQPIRYRFRLALVHEYLRYGVTPSALADFSSREQRIALGLDPTTGRGAGTLGSIDVDLERVSVDNAAEPTHGTITSLHLEHAAPWLLGTYQFNEVLFEGRGYVSVGHTVLASKLRLGTILAGDPSTVPFSKLYFLGGATSLRGWGIFQVSPLDPQGFPIGGRTLGELTVELRVPMTAKIGVVLFSDAGDVGANSGRFNALRPQLDAGAGLRYHTIIGAIRVDVGYQLTRIPGLLVNGSPETRHWRIHFSLGEAF